ncbi:MAG: glycosyltransferase family 39 protein [Acidobacteriaceae bacterium]
MPPIAIGFLLLSAVIALIRAHYQILGIDEYGFGLLDLCSRSSFAHFVHIQLTAPISFDPIGYNALIYGVIHYFGTGAMTMRLPSIAGYLLMQVCLYWIVRRIANEWAGTVALALPALLGVVAYSLEARPYAVMLGLAALAMLCWQTASRRNEGRTLALVGLAVSLALAINMQYYAVLLFVPVCAAEAVRTMKARRVDVPMVGAIAGGLAGLILVIPFARALSQFQANHGDLRVQNFHFITHSYLWLLIGYENLSVGQQHLVGGCCALLLLVLVAGFARARRNLGLRLPTAEAVLLLLLAAIPVFAFLLAVAVTHFVEARYVLPAVIGLCAVIAILLTPLSQNRVLRRLALALLFVGITVAGVEHVRSDRKSAEEYAALLTISPEMQQVLDKHPGEPIYVMNHFVFEFIHYYAPSEDIRSRVALIYLEPQDFGKEGVVADVNRQMANMEADGVPEVYSYESVAKPGTEQLFLLYYGPWEWTDRRIAAAHAEVTKVGRFFGGEVELVRFP